MSSIDRTRSRRTTAIQSPAIRRFFVGAGIVSSLVGCVSQSTYDFAASETDSVRAEVIKTRSEVQALEQQKEALQKLSREGETILAGIRAELQSAREAYAEHKVRLNKLGALQEKARTLSRQQTSYTQGIRTAKQKAEKMQALISQYEKESRATPDALDALKVSQSFEMNPDTSKMVATVSPLPSAGTRSPEQSAEMSPPESTPHPAASAGPLFSTTRSPAALPPQAQPAKTISTTTTPAPTTPPARPQPPTDESWMASLSGWIASLWDWLFS